MTVTENGKRKNMHITSSDDPIACFEAYKLAKEQHFKVMADRFKHLLSSAAYDALMVREVDLDD